jgi:eukaryotic-like serine/threonine-protein kinase
MPADRAPEDDSLPEAIFAAGQVVGNRYRVIRPVASGGMGEVYEAEDRELGERVALKTIRRERADSTTAIERFKRELALARKVTHPNVCRVFDVGFHHADDGAPVPFFTMELLAGETLAERIARGGPLDPALALGLAQQMAEALDAAHAVGVIHRDLKTQNVMLVPGPGGSLRAVVTDFGLARSNDRDPAQGRTTRTGTILGTPGYMSPEQLAGGPLTPASDLYSFGVVLFEMVTGRLPLTGSPTVVVRSPASAPPPPLLGAPLPPGWLAAILPLLSPEPSARPPGAREAIALVGTGPVAPIVVAAPVAAPVGRWRLVLVAVPVLAAAVMMVARPFRRSTGDIPADPAVARIYAEGLASLGRADARGARARLEQVTARDPGFPLGHLALAQAWRGLGQQADHEREANLAWQQAARLPREARLEVEAGWRVAHRQWGPAVELYSALVELAPRSVEHRLRLARAETDGGRAREALATLDRLERDLPAAAADPRVLLAEAAASETVADYHRSGERARQAGAIARTLGAPGMVGEALLLESYAALQLGQRKLAAEKAAEGYEIFRQANDRYGMGRALRRQGRVAWKTGELARAVAAFDEASAIFRAVGDDLELARAYQGRAGAVSDLGREKEATELYRTILLLYEKTGDRVGLAETHCNLGNALQHARQLTESEVEHQRGLALARELGKKNSEAISLENLGWLYLDRGDLARAVATEEQAVAVAQQIGDVTTMAQARSKLAEALHHQGNTARAEELFRQSIASLEQLGERARVANAQLRLASLLLDLARTAEAETLARRAVELHEAVGVATGESGAVLARALLAAHRTGEARVAVDRAFRQGSDLPLETAAAEVELAERQPARAAGRLRRALARALPPAGQGFAAQRVLGQAELASGNRAAARARWRSIATEAASKGFALDAHQAQALLGR